jgi:OOP family OmpA-OmpF porin
LVIDSCDSAGAGRFNRLEERTMSSSARGLLATVLVSLLSLPTLALSQVPDTGWYIGIGIGQSKAKGACDGLSGSGVTCDDTDTAGKILGGYQLSKNFALELAYADLGKAKATFGAGGSATFGTKGFEFSGIGMLPLTEQFSVFAKAGLFSWKVDAKASGPVGSASASGTDLTFGFGLKFDFTKDFAARAEWQRYKDVGDMNTTGQGDVDFIGVSLVYKL